MKKLSLLITLISLFTSVVEARTKPQTMTNNTSGSTADNSLEEKQNGYSSDEQENMPGSQGYE